MKYNIVNEYIEFQRKTISSCIKKIIEDYFVEEYFNELFSIYVDARYYDYYNYSSNDLENNICKLLRKKAIDLMQDNTEENNLKIKEILFIFNFILYLDEVKTIDKNSTFINYVYKYRKQLLNKDDVEFKTFLLKYIEDNRDKRDKFINKFTCHDFFVKFFSTSKTGVFDVMLNYRLEFPKLYSDYAIDRVFNTGVVSEDKLSIEYIFITLRVLDDVRACVYDKNYLLEFASSLLEKKTKIEGILEIINNDCVKDKVALKIDYETYKVYKDNIFDLMKEGYAFAIMLNDENILSDSFFDSLEMFKYIIINNDSKYCHLMSSNDKIIKINKK